MTAALVRRKAGYR